MRAAMAVCFCLLGTNGAQACHVRPYVWSYKFVSTAYLTVQKNEQDCISRMYVASTRIYRVRVTKNGTHGTAIIVRLSHWAYRPQPGFVGNDTFSLEINYEAPGLGQPVNATLNVDVEVVDH